MAAKTPSGRGDTGYVDIDRGVHGESNINTTLLKEGLKHRIFAFSDLDDTDTWASGIDGIQMLACHTTTDDAVRATVSGSTVTFAVYDASGAASNVATYVHVWSTQ